MKAKYFSCFYCTILFGCAKNYFLFSINSTHYFIMNIPNKREVQQIVFNHSSDTDFKDFMNLYKKYFLLFILYQISLHVSEIILEGVFNHDN